MSSRDLARIVTLVPAVLIFSLSSCSHQKPVADMAGAPAMGADDQDALGSSDQGKALGLNTIHFSFDSSLLDQETKGLLEKNATILKSHPTAKIQIEGHCDSRGGIQYNIALGERRAVSVSHYLQDLGVSKERLSVISYGKERPLVQGDTEEAYAKNRRANFVLTAR